MQTTYHAPTREPDPYFASLLDAARHQGRRCIVNAIVPNPDGKVLVLKRALSKPFLPGCWDLPGGHLDHDELLESALRREVNEEIGARIRTIRALIAIWDWEKPGSDPAMRICVRQFEFLVDLVEAPLDLNLLDFTESRWLGEPELPLFMENRQRGDTQMLEVLRHAFRVMSKHS
jgi:8-oxo-dGTP pyrophosphatase MutT (NUDIX family)